MKTICVRAKQTKQRDERILNILNKYSSLAPRPLGTGTVEGQAFPIVRQYVEWMEDDGETQINIEVYDETIIERLASELKACGCVVKVLTEEQYDKLADVE